MKSLFNILLSATIIIASPSFAASKHDMPVDGLKTEILSKSNKSWEESALPAYPTGAAEISVLKYTIPRSVEISMHKTAVMNAGYVVAGELTVQTSDGKEMHLKAGEALIQTVDKWVSYKNEGNAVAELVIFYAGEKGKPIIVYKSAK